MALFLSIIERLIAIEIYIVLSFRLHGHIIRRSSLFCLLDFLAATVLFARHLLTYDFCLLILSYGIRFVACLGVVDFTLQCF